jgi:hypothetical protein
VGRQLTLVRATGLAWAVFVAAVLASALPTVSADAVAFVSAAGLVSILASLGAALTARRSPSSAGAFLVVAALAAPTFGLVWLNLVPLAVGVHSLRGTRRAPAIDHP